MKQRTKKKKILIGLLVFALAAQAIRPSKNRGRKTSHLRLDKKTNTRSFNGPLISD